jgi:tellurite resistance protein
MLSGSREREILWRKLVESTLYKAATEAIVSETSATSTYEKMIEVAHSHKDLESFQTELIETESTIKKEFELKSMPGPWRSAKSVIVTAMRIKIPLVDTNGTFFGKTNLQNQIKAIKMEKELTEEQWASKIAYLIDTIPGYMNEGKVIAIIAEYLRLKPART